MASDLFEEAVAAGKQRDEDAAAIVAAAGAANEAVGFEAVDEFDGAVMLEGEAFGEVLNGGLAALGEATNGEEHQVLLRLEAYGAGFGVAFAKEVADAVAQLGEGAVLRGSDVRRHDRSISYCDITGQGEEAQMLLKREGLVAEEENADRKTSVIVGWPVEVGGKEGESAEAGVESTLRREGTKAREQLLDGVFVVGFETEGCEAGVVEAVAANEVGDQKH
jgi:hypothetical protein